MQETRTPTPLQVSPVPPHQWGKRSRGCSQQLLSPLPSQRPHRQAGTHPQHTSLLDGGSMQLPLPCSQRWPCGQAPHAPAAGFWVARLSPQLTVW